MIDGLAFPPSSSSVLFYYFFIVTCVSFNRMIELDSKSLNSLAGTGTSIASGHSRKSSDASQISLNSGKDLFFIIATILLFFTSPKNYSRRLTSL